MENQRSTKRMKIKMEEHYKKGRKNVRVWLMKSTKKNIKTTTNHNTA
jgi:hypothetical protein